MTDMTLEAPEDSVDVVEGESGAETFEGTWMNRQTVKAFEQGLGVDGTLLLHL